MTKNPRDRAELKNVLRQLHGVDFSSDFHTLKSSQADALADMATTVGYRKPKNANGSTARYFFNYLNKKDSIK